jgi:hypothetical protein
MAFELARAAPPASGIPARIDRDKAFRHARRKALTQRLNEPASPTATSIPAAECCAQRVCRQRSLFRLFN